MGVGNGTDTKHQIQQYQQIQHLSNGKSPVSHQAMEIVQRSFLTRQDLTIIHVSLNGGSYVKEVLISKLILIDSLIYWQNVRHNNIYEGKCALLNKKSTRSLFQQLYRTSRLVELSRKRKKWLHLVQ